MKVNPTSNIPTKTSTAEEWRYWYMACKKSFGKKVARDLFVRAWAKRGSDKANINSLRDYMSGEGVKIETSILGNITDFADDIGDTIGGIFNAGKIAIYAVGGIIIVGLGIFVFSIARKPAAAIGAVTGLRKGGAK